MRCDCAALNGGRKTLVGGSTGGNRRNSFADHLAGHTQRSHMHRHTCTNTRSRFHFEAIASLIPDNQKGDCGDD